MKVVYTTGVFDILHKGHITLLQKARLLGDRLVVGVQEDISVEKQKGVRPVLSCAERMETLLALPFVDECVPYHNVDQSDGLPKVLPDIMVQTDEWQSQTDRGSILAYLQNNNIELVILPIHKDISSSEIKRRVKNQASSFRKDLAALSSSLAIIPIDEISFYELSNPLKKESLIDRIQKSQIFFNPITLAKYEQRYVLIDGANRYEALRELGAKYVFAQMVDYTSSAQVELMKNVHFLHIRAREFLHLLEQSSLSYSLVDEIGTAEEAEHLVQVSFVDHPSIVVEGTSTSSTGVEKINALVRAYIHTVPFARLSEISQGDNNEYGTQITFPEFTILDIMRLISSQQMLASGVTWHNVKQHILHFSVPLSILRGEHHAKQGQDAQHWLQERIAWSLEQGHIRYYPSSVYLCDEWL